MRIFNKKALVLFISLFFIGVLIFFSVKDFSPEIQNTEVQIGIKE